MKKIPLLLTAAVMGICSIYSHAQTTTTTLTITPNVYSCFQFNATYPLCDGIPVTDQNGNKGSFWLYEGDGDWISFQGDFAYLDGILAQITSHSYSGTGNTVIGTATFKGETYDGVPFTGTVTYTVTVTYRHYRGLYSYGLFTGGTVTINQ